jgi:tRNA-2-methylthio-N6-dimethylallyladenosine synthase
MNEDQRLGRLGNTKGSTAESIEKPKKDYSKYFDFSNAKVISEEENKKVIRIEGREISIYNQPDYKQGKRRGKEDVQVLIA